MSGVAYCLVMCPVKHKSNSRWKKKQHSDFELWHLAHFICLLDYVLTYFLFILFLAIWLTLPHSAQQLNRMHSVIFTDAYSFFIAFMTKLSPPHVCSALWPKALASSKHARWWRKSDGSKNNPRGSEVLQILLPESKLKSNNFTKCWECFLVETEVGRVDLSYIFNFSV